MYKELFAEFLGTMFLLLAVIKTGAQCKDVNSGDVKTRYLNVERMLVLLEELVIEI